MGKQRQGKFTAWIRKNGYIETARILGLTPERVRQWVVRKSTPRTVIINKIVKAGRGAFTLSDIINDTTK